MEDDGNYYYDLSENEWIENAGYSNGWVFAALFLFFIIILFIWGVLAATGDVNNPFIDLNKDDNQNFDTFNISVVRKNKNHPSFDKGSDLGYLVNGVHGRSLRLMACKTYKFNVDAPGHPFYITTSPIGSDDSQSMVNIVGTPIENGTFTLTISKDLPQPLYYQCAVHKYMGGRIILTHSDSDMCGSTESNSLVHDKSPATSSPKCKTKKNKGYKKLKDKDVTDTSVFYNSD